MIRTITKKLTVANGTQELFQILSAVEGSQKKIIGFRFEPVADTKFVAFIEQDQIQEVAGEVWGTDAPTLPVDHIMTTGEVIQAGFRNDSGGSLELSYTIIYEENL